QKDELPLFRQEDVWELADLAMAGSELKPVTRAILNKIRTEGEKHSDFTETDRLLSALNDRSRPALRAALGLNERVISDVFTELREHWSEGDPPPSRCMTCEHREPCHRTFGVQEGYGLYPFTASAI